MELVPLRAAPVPMCFGVEYARRQSDSSCRRRLMTALLRETGSSCEAGDGETEGSNPGDDPGDESAHAISIERDGIDRDPNKRQKGSATIEERDPTMPCEPGNIDTTTPTGLTENSTEFVRLRRATPDDAAALGLIGSAAFLEAFTWLLPGPDILAFCARNHTAEAYAKYLALPDTSITLAETATGAPVGYAMLTAPDLSSVEGHPGDIELKRIYLLSRFRSLKTPVLDDAGQVVEGLRTGQALMDAAISNARAMGRTRLLLGTHAGNQRAIAFYHRNGFLEAGTRSFHVGSQICCDFILAKTL